MNKWIDNIMNIFMNRMIDKIQKKIEVQIYGWIIMMSGVPWCTMEYYEGPWSTMKYHEKPWSIMKCHEVPWSTMKYHKVP